MERAQVIACWEDFSARLRPWPCASRLWESTAWFRILWPNGLTRSDCGWRSEEVCSDWWSEVRYFLPP